jgi:hypothetical protein
VDPMLLVNGWLPHVAPSPAFGRGTAGATIDPSNSTGGTRSLFSRRRVARYHYFCLPSPRSRRRLSQFFCALGMDFCTAQVLGDY